MINVRELLSPDSDPREEEEDPVLISYSYTDATTTTVIEYTLDES